MIELNGLTKRSGQVAAARALLPSWPGAVHPSGVMLSYESSDEVLA
jgi:hypothetical protein